MISRGAVAGKAISDIHKSQHEKKSLKELVEKEEKAAHEYESVQSQKSSFFLTHYNDPDYSGYSKYKDELVWKRKYDVEASLLMFNL